MRFQNAFSSLALSFGLVAVAAAAPPIGPESKVSFNKDVRPILSDKCFTCHGPDEKKRLSGLRLDNFEGATRDLGGRAAIVPGDPDASEIIRRVTHESEALRMPPAYAGTGKTISDAELGVLRRWIAQGAEYQGHWSFLQVKRPVPPAVGGAELAPIDRFVRARLAAEGLEAAPEAGRETLLRRVSLDLTGLPPTPEEIDAFLADRSENAYETVVDRLLASPRYGERMAIRWLDGARYADTNGYQTDAWRDMWRWRDWVIEAFNNNKPFDQFTVEQLAGDLLPNPTREQRIATGFNRNHRANSEGGIVPEEYLVEYVVDRVDTTATVFMGLTLGCARCHDHKFDPLTQKDFYSFYAFFNNIPERGRVFKYGNTPPMIPAPTRAQQTELQAADERLEQASQAFDARREAIAKGFRRWEKSLAGEKDEARWEPTLDRVAAYELEQGEAGWTFEGGEPAFAEGVRGQAVELDGTRRVNAGDTANFGYLDAFTLSAWIKPSGPTGAIVARTNKEKDGQDLGWGGYGLYLVDGKLQFNLIQRWLDDGLRVESAEALPLNAWNHVAVTYDGSRMADGIEFFVNGKRVEKTVILDLMNQQTGVKEPLLIGMGGGLNTGFQGLIDGVRVFEAALDEPGVALLAEPASLNELARLEADPKPQAAQDLLRLAYLNQYGPEPDRKAWADLVGRRRERKTLLDSFPTVMVMQELPEPRETHVLNRGAYDQPTDRVERRAPSSLPPLPADAPRDRLGLARWLVSPQHPLTSRVTVNRIWAMFFGRGIVKTVEDFGSQGEWPSHPELLDWLAADFMDSGWDVKALVKTIVMSKTYRQASMADAALLERDPDNSLLARGPRLRLPAEMVRDQALLASGLLVEKVGGPSVKPYQPAGLWEELAGQKYEADTGEGLYRRSLYTYWKRTAPPPFMMNFDAAGRETCVVGQTRTNTPLQALNLMNDVTYVEAARMLAERMIREGGNDVDGRIARGYRLLLGREPRPAERATLHRSYEHYLERFQGDRAAALELLSSGEHPRDESLDPAEHAATATVASLLLNLDEAVTKQ
ncbi:MAG: DUF1553 domain-containing protein [Acidobacteria bacterium]|nr:DUF1553 domain-containing protein [Acidobacteriota bacterium]